MASVNKWNCNRRLCPWEQLRLAYILDEGCDCHDGDGVSAVEQCRHLNPGIVGRGFRLAACLPHEVCSFSSASFLESDYNLTLRSTNFRRLIFKYSVSTSQQAHCVYIIKTIRLMLFRQIDAVYCDYHTKHWNKRLEDGEELSAMKHVVHIVTNIFQTVKETEWQPHSKEMSWVSVKLKFVCWYTYRPSQ
jgi:hypothetical protein